MSKNKHIAHQEYQYVRIAYQTNASKPMEQKLCVGAWNVLRDGTQDFALLHQDELQWWLQRGQGHIAFSFPDTAPSAQLDAWKELCTQNKQTFSVYENPVSDLYSAIQHSLSRAAHAKVSV